MKCKKCGKEKQIDDFPKHKQCRAGVINTCKNCQKEYLKQWKKKNPDKIKKYNKTRNETGIGRKCLREWQKKNKDKIKQNLSRPEVRLKHLARLTLNNSIKLGKTKRMFCEICGEEKSEAHHEDYNKPLEVMWLCNKHHRELHKLKEIICPR